MRDLAPMDVVGRLGRLRARFAEVGADAVVVTDLVNIRYLTGFTGSNGILAVMADWAVLVTDGRYRTQASEQLTAAGVEVDIVIAVDPDPELARLVGGVARVGLEADHVTWATQRRWAADTLAAADLVPTDGIILGLRAVKDAGEIDRLRAASRIADDALAEVRHALHERPTELEFRRLLEDAMTDRGSDGPSFDTIVASGPNGAKPHARPGDRVIGSSERGEWVVVDYGATVDGYHSDMTRTIGVGELSTTQERMFEIVREAQAAGVATVRAGVAAKTVDDACRDVIDDAGWGDAFAHGTGHGIGLVIHEWPRVGSTSEDILATGQCVTVEPGVYLEEHGGVRIEDSVVVTESGCDPLTRSPYAPR